MAASATLDYAHHNAPEKKRSGPAAVRLVDTIINICPPGEEVIDSRMARRATLTPEKSRDHSMAISQNPPRGLLTKREAERYIYDLVVDSVLAPFGARVGEAGLVWPPALDKALGSVLHQVELREFSTETNQLFRSLWARLDEVMLLNCVFTTIYLVGYVAVELEKSLPGYTSPAPLGSRILRQMCLSVIGDEISQDDLSVILDVCSALAVTADLVRQSSTANAIFPKFPMFAPCKYTSTGFLETRNNKTTYEKLVKHFSKNGFPQPLENHPDAGSISDWCFLSGDASTNSRTFDVEKADKNIAENFGRVMIWLVCSAHRLPSGTAIVAYYEQHIALIEWLGSRFGFTILRAATDMDLRGRHDHINNKKMRAVFDSWLVIMPSQASRIDVAVPRKSRRNTMSSKVAPQLSPAILKPYIGPTETFGGRNIIQSPYMQKPIVSPVADPRITYTPQSQLQQEHEDGHRSPRMDTFQQALTEEQPTLAAQGVSYFGTFNSVDDASHHENPIMEPTSIHQTNEVSKTFNTPTETMVDFDTPPPHSLTSAQPRTDHHQRVPFMKRPPPPPPPPRRRTLSAKQGQDRQMRRSNTEFNRHGPAPIRSSPMLGPYPILQTRSPPTKPVVELLPPFDPSFSRPLLTPPTADIYSSAPDRPTDPLASPQSTVQGSTIPSDSPEAMTHGSISYNQGPSRSVQRVESYVSPPHSAAITPVPHSDPTNLIEEAESQTHPRQAQSGETPYFPTTTGKIFDEATSNIPAMVASRSQDNSGVANIHSSEIDDAPFIGPLPPPRPAVASVSSYSAVPLSVLSASMWNGTSQRWGSEQQSQSRTATTTELLRNPVDQKLPLPQPVRSEIAPSTRDTWSQDVAQPALRLSSSSQNTALSSASAASRNTDAMLSSERSSQTAMSPVMESHVSSVANRAAAADNTKITDAHYEEGIGPRTAEQIMAIGEAKIRAKSSLQNISNTPLKRYSTWRPTQKSARRESDGRTTTSRESGPYGSLNRPPSTGLMQHEERDHKVKNPSKTSSENSLEDMGSIYSEREGHHGTPPHNTKSRMGSLAVMGDYGNDLYHHFGDIAPTVLVTSANMSVDETPDHNSDVDIASIAVDPAYIAAADLKTSPSTIQRMMMADELDILNQVDHSSPSNALPSAEPSSPLLGPVRPPPPAEERGQAFPTSPRVDDRTVGQSSALDQGLERVSEKRDVGHSHDDTLASDVRIANDERTAKENVEEGFSGRDKEADNFDTAEQDNEEPNITESNAKSSAGSVSSLASFVTTAGKALSNIFAGAPSEEAVGEREPTVSSISEGTNQRNAALDYSSLSESLQQGNVQKSSVGHAPPLVEPANSETQSASRRMDDNDTATRLPQLLSKAEQQDGALQSQPESKRESEPESSSELIEKDVHSVEPLNSNEGLSRNNATSAPMAESKLDVKETLLSEKVQTENTADNSQFEEHRTSSNTSVEDSTPPNETTNPSFYPLQPTPSIPFSPGSEKSFKLVEIESPNRSAKAKLVAIPSSHTANVSPSGSAAPEAFMAQLAQLPPPEIGQLPPVSTKEAHMSDDTAAVSKPSVRARRKAPPPPKKVILATALYDFEPEDEAEELAFNEGDTIEITEKSEELEADGWCKARRSGTKKEGLVPLEYLEIVEPRAVPETKVTSKQPAGIGASSKTAITLPGNVGHKTDVSFPSSVNGAVNVDQAPASSQPRHADMISTSTMAPIELEDTDTTTSNRPPLDKGDGILSTNPTASSTESHPVLDSDLNSRQVNDSPVTTVELSAIPSSLFSLSQKRQVGESNSHSSTEATARPSYISLASLPQPLNPSTPPPLTPKSPLRQLRVRSLLLDASPPAQSPSGQRGAGSPAAHLRSSSSPFPASPSTPRATLIADNSYFPPQSVSAPAPTVTTLPPIPFRSNARVATMTFPLRYWDDLTGFVEHSLQP